MYFPRCILPIERDDPQKKQEWGPQLAKFSPCGVACSLQSRLELVSAEYSVCLDSPTSCRSMLRRKHQAQLNPYSFHAQASTPYVWRAQTSPRSPPQRIPSIARAIQVSRRELSRNPQQMSIFTPRRKRIRVEAQWLDMAGEGSYLLQGPAGAGFSAFGPMCKALDDRFAGPACLVVGDEGAEPIL